MIGINAKSEGFLKCDPKVLNHIAGLDRLSCTESELFQACMRRFDIAE